MKILLIVGVYIFCSFFNCQKDNCRDVVKNEEVTLVTGYFKLGSYRLRSETDYIEIFKQWARFKNNLILFCETKEVRDLVMSIRECFGQGNKTKVVIVNDIKLIEKEMYEKMAEISNDSYFQNYARKTTHPRYRNPDYVYMANIKMYWLFKASLEFDIETKSIAWIDFGFGHGKQGCSEGMRYPYGEDFSFTLECEVGKVYFTKLLIYPDLKRPMFEIMRDPGKNIVDSGFVVCPTNSTGVLWKMFRDNVFLFLNLGLMFDDQVMLWYLSQKEKEIFEIKTADDWAEGPLKFCNGNMRFTKQYHIKKKKEIKI